MTKIGWLYLCFTAAAAVAILALLASFAWHACRTPAWAVLLAGAQSCPEFWLNRYQTLLAALIALGAAVAAIFPARRQLAEMKRQSEHVRYEQMRARSLELNHERDLIYGLTAAASNLADAFTVFGTTRQKLLEASPTVDVVLQPQELQLLTAHSDFFDEQVQQFMDKIGPQWGNESLQTKRQLSLEAAQRFASRCSKYLRTLTLNTPVSMLELTSAATDMLTHKTNLFKNAIEVHEAIELERSRLGRMIADAEASLFKD